MRAHMLEGNLEQSRGHARRVPLCYARQATGDGTQAHGDSESSAIIAVYSVVACAAAAFLIVYGGWEL
jgi:hypothetical protein